MKTSEMLCETLDLDSTTDIANDYERAKNTIKYLTDFCSSVEARVKAGEIIPRMALVPGNRTRYITDIGLKILEKSLGERIYAKKPIGITELENLVGKEEMDDYAEAGIIAFKEGTPKIIVSGVK